MDGGNGKAKAPASGQNGFRNGAPGGADNPIINVQPPRREDLQPAYAQTLQGDDDAGTHGWYGSMSMSPSSIIGLTRSLIRHSQYPG